ncbi:MAG: hypothetical protein R3F43_05530 [bacterium]
MALGATPVVGSVDALLAHADIPRMKLYGILWEPRAQVPHHEPILRDFEYWLADPNRAQRDTLAGIQADWLSASRPWRPRIVCGGSAARPAPDQVAEADRPARRAVLAALA